MKLTRISSSSNVHGPLFIPIFVQHGVVIFLATDLFPLDDVMSTVFSIVLSLSLSLFMLGFGDLSDWLAFLKYIHSLSSLSSDVANEPTYFLLTL